MNFLFEKGSRKRVRFLGVYDLNGFRFSGGFITFSMMNCRIQHRCFPILRAMVRVSFSMDFGDFKRESPVLTSVVKKPVGEVFPEHRTQASN